MATKKTTKKTTKTKVEKTENLEKIIKKASAKLTDDELILGVQPKQEVIKEYDYENEKVKYLVTNLLVEESTPSIVTGDVIETFIGSRNKKAREELKKGIKEVITYEYFTNKPMYKIEVIK